MLADCRGIETTASKSFISHDQPWYHMHATHGLWEKSTVWIIPNYFWDNIWEQCCVFCFWATECQQQLSKLGLYATCLKEKNDAAVLDESKTGDYTYIYTNPEHMIGKITIYDILVSQVYSSNTCLIVVDEAHCVLDWGRVRNTGHFPAILRICAPFYPMQKCLH